MDKIQLQATKRKILGKKVSVLRRQGITPVHLFGHGIESVALQSDTTKLQRALARAGKTGLISLKFDKEESPRNVMVREVQTEPLTGETLHVDFYQVRMGEKVSVKVPVVFVGEAPALKSKDNMLVHELNALTVECLPDKIPASVVLDVSALTEAEQALRVKDIKLDEDITVLNDPGVVLARISVRRAEKVEEVVVAEEAVVEAAEAAEAAPSQEKESKE